MEYKVIDHSHPDGFELWKATDAADLVRQLHQDSRAPAGTDEDFMQEYAERVKLVSGDEISYESPELFIADLIRIGRLKEHRPT